MRPPRFFLKNSFYHLLGHGNNQNIFLFKRDFEKYLYYLEKYSERFQIRILAFALMPNHLHLLARQSSEVPISKFMHVTTTAYVTYFNLKHHRGGHLFQGRFKHIAVETDEYLVHLSRYIHLNPSSAGLVSKPEKYQWSSYRTYLGKDHFNFIDKDTILNCFSKNASIQDYKEFVDSRVQYQKDISLQKLFLE